MEDLKLYISDLDKVSNPALLAKTDSASATPLKISEESIPNPRYRDATEDEKGLLFVDLNGVRIIK
jgi:hypothetical protein